MCVVLIILMVLVMVICWVWIWCCLRWGDCCWIILKWCMGGMLMARFGSCRFGMVVILISCGCVVRVSVVLDVLKMVMLKCCGIIWW